MAMAPALSFTVLVGNPKPRSRTRALAICAATLLRERLRAAAVEVGEPVVVDLAELAPELLRGAIEAPAALHPAHAAVCGSELVLVASPTFKGTFTGLLKLFVDPLPRKALARTVAIPLMTAASAQSQHAVESYLRPLLLALGATVPVCGLSILESQFDARERVLGVWASDSAPVLGGLLAAVGSPQAAAVDPGAEERDLLVGPRLVTRHRAVG